MGEARSLWFARMLIVAFGGKEMPVFYRDGPTALLMTGYIDSSARVEGPGRADYLPRWVGR